MPSQNLPKPNLPGQSNQSISPSAPIEPQVSSQTIFSQQPVAGSQPQQPQQLQTPPQAQVVPGGLSRENPGGTPPNMRVSVSAPPTSQEQLNAVSNQAKPVEPITTSRRPMGPLDQISLKSSLPNSPAVSASSVSQTKSSSLPPITDSSPTINPEPIIKTSKNNTTVDAELAEKPLGLLSKLKNKKFPLPLLVGGGVLLLILVAVLLFSLFKPKSSSTTKQSSTTSGSNTATTSATTGQITTVTYWGLWEDSQVLKEVIADFESKNQNIKIDYRKQSHRDYRERLQQAILSGNGPDIFRYHVAWVPMLSADLSAMPASVMSVAEYKEIFYPTAYNNLQVGGQIVGIPLMYDGLALFYNKEMLKTANIEVPKTWAELRTAANKLTVPANVSERTNLTRAGLAIGNAGNVDHFSDILALLIIQNGGNPSDATSQYVKDAITFYTNFIKQDKVWSDRLANSTTAFARGDVAMIFAPSWRVHDIKSINPELDFAVTGVPQLDSENPATWATFWAEGVSAKSKNKDAAWTFLKYLSNPEVLRKFYNDASQYRAFGEIYPRVDMASELQNSELVSAYVSDAPLSKSWYMSSFTHDNGINDQIIKYYEDAINTVLSGSDVAKALETAKTGIATVLSKYSSSK